MDGFRLTRGSPLPDLPWLTTQVDIYRAANNRRVTVPLIDLGPAAPPHAHAAIDLTVAAFRALGGDPTSGDMHVDFRIRAARSTCPADILAAVRASLREAPPHAPDGPSAHPAPRPILAPPRPPCSFPRHRRTRRERRPRPRRRAQPRAGRRPAASAWPSRRRGRPASS